MSKRVANKKHTRVPPARSTKSRARLLAKLAAARRRREAAVRRTEMLAEVRRRFGEL